MVFFTSRTRTVQKFAFFLFLVAFSDLAVSQATQAVSGFAPQKRVGYTTGDQWEPAMAADGHGHLYILYPQYGPVPNCPGCTAPSITLLVSSDNGGSWQPSRPLVPFPTGQFDPQIVVDPQDKQTVYASWLQNNKRDIIVARSLDFGRSWSLSVADHAAANGDKPVLAVRGSDVYVGFNHEEKFFVAASHDAGQTFSRVNVNPAAGPGWSLAGGATVDSAGAVYFGWTAYARHEMPSRPVSVYLSRSADSGRTWTTTLLDVSSAPPDCDGLACDTGYLGAQVALASDAAGTIYAVWNAGAVNGGPERIYFSSSTTAGATWSSRADVSAARQGVEGCFPTIAAGTSGDVRIAWMDTRAMDSHNHPLWNTYYRSSTNGGATWSAETKLSGPARFYDYVLPAGFRFPFGGDDSNLDGGDLRFYGVEFAGNEHVQIT